MTVASSSILRRCPSASCTLICAVRSISCAFAVSATICCWTTCACNSVALSAITCCFFTSASYPARLERQVALELGLFCLRSRLGLDPRLIGARLGHRRFAAGRRLLNLRVTGG